MKKICLLVILFLVNVVFVLAQVTVTFNYTGAVQTYTVPACATSITIDVRGGQGMGNTNGSLRGGLGGRVVGTMVVTPGQVLEIYVGNGNVVSNPGGWPDGGNGGLSFIGLSTGCAGALPYCWNNPTCPTANGGGGGGSSDVRVAPYGLANAVAIGGGGGGSGGDRIMGCGPGAGGGGGGGYYGGGGGGGYSGQPGQGGAQVAGGAAGCSPGCAIYDGLCGTAGSLGAGGTGGGAPGNNQGGNNPGCTGGCGGTNTGGAGVDCSGDNCPGLWSGGSGGGGSNYVSPILTAVTQTACYQSGTGQVLITSCGAVLPIQLQSFECVNTENGIELNWATATETNNKEFTVERSSDGINFTPLSTIPGAGNSENVKYYSFLDTNPANGINYYSLSQTDYDGNIHELEITDCNYNSVTPYIYPNPSNGSFTLNLPSSPNIQNIIITDIVGRQVYEQQYQPSTVFLNHPVVLPSLINGVYLVKISDGNITTVKKLIIQ